MGRTRSGRVEPIAVAPQGLTLGLGKLEQVEQRAAEATEGRRLLESEMQGQEDEQRRQKREEQARRERIVEDAVQEMRFVCDVCGNKSYKNITDYTNHLDSYDHHHAKRMMEFKQQARGSDADRAAEREERKAREAKEAEKEMKRMQQAVAVAAAAAEKAAAAAAEKAAAAAASAALSNTPPHAAAAPVTVKFGLGACVRPAAQHSPPAPFKRSRLSVFRNEAPCGGGEACRCF